MRFNRFDWWQKKLAQVDHPCQTEADAQAAIEALYQTHRSSLKVAALLGCHDTTVRNRLKWAGVALEPSGYPQDRINILRQKRTEEGKT